MKCNRCGKFMEYVETRDFTDYYRCVDECEGNKVADDSSEEKNMDYADKINNLSKKDLR